MTQPTVGIVGLGKMGLPMARNLLAASLPVVAFDLVESARSAAEQAGAHVPNTLREVGAASDVVITMLPTGGIVSEVVLGPDGIADGLEAGAIVVDMGSSAPNETIALGQQLAKRGIRMVDAPVSGGVSRAITGELSIFVGGLDEDVDAVLPVLNHLGTRVFRTGALGTGHTVKALNNLLSAACFAATIEVVRIAQRSGIDPDLMAEVLNNSTGRNNTTEVKLRRHVLAERYDSGFALSLMLKDLQQAGRIADSVGADVPLSRSVIQLWSAAADRLAADADHTEFARVVDSGEVDR